MSGSLVAARDGPDHLRLTLNRPDQANAIDDELCDALLAQLRAAAEDGTRFDVTPGRLDRARYQRFGAFLAKAGMIRRAPDVGEIAIETPGAP